MIRIHTNHSHQRDIYEITKVFFPGEDLVFDEPADLVSLVDGDGVETRLDIDGYKRKNALKLRDFPVFEVLGHAESKALRYSLYTCLRDKKDLPWGMLMGVRPGKLARQIMDKGLDLEEILVKYFFLSEDRARLLKDINLVQEPIINKYKDGYSLYVNIPFCPSICSYCSYPVLRLGESENLVPAYVDRVLEEIDYVYKAYGRPPSMAYIGGGTPSAIGRGQLEKIVDKVLSLGGLDGFTVEIGREDTIDEDMLRMLDGRADRICINPQTMVDKTTRSLGRLQSSQGVIRAYELARKYGFIINMDTIIGLPGEGFEDIKYTFDSLTSLGPENITVHSLALKKGSDLRDKAYEHGERIGGLMDRAKESLKESSYRPYYIYRQKDIGGALENLGYAKTGFESAYNIVSMEESQTIIGVGMGAVSKFILDGRPTRASNFRSMDDYMNRFDEVLDKKNPEKLFKV